MNKTQDIRGRFELALVEGLKGVPVITDEGVPVLREDGTAAVVPPPAQFLSVVRAYLKDQDDGTDKRPPVPQPGEPKGALADFLSKNGGKLPFAATVKQ